jgi:hypothetical protein
VRKKRSYQVKLWRKLRQAHGAPLPPAVRAFLATQHARALAERLPRELVVRDMLGTLANLKAHGLWPADDERPLELPRGSRDAGRVPLWRELRDRRAELLGERPDEPPWTALRVGRQREAGMIVFTFDNRLTDKTVKGALKDELPRLRARGWTRAARPLSAFELALVRYVCLESDPQGSWRQRAIGWRHSRFCKAHPKWGRRYRGKRAGRRFKKDFHAAEARLAGEKGALGVHYDTHVHKRNTSSRHGYAETQSMVSDDAAAQRPEITAWPRVAPARAEALRARFAVAAEIEALVVRAQAGDSAAADEAVALCLRWRPAAIDELYARLGRMHEDNPGDPDQSGHVE